MLDLRSADDVALTAEGVKDIEHQSNTLKKKSLNLKIGLRIHKGKTKFMTNADTKDIIQIDGAEIEKMTIAVEQGKKLL